MLRKMMKVAAAVMCAALVAGTFSGVSAGMRKEVLSSTKTLPAVGEFNVIAEPFGWGKDVTRIMINNENKVSAADVNASDFKVNAKHYSEQALKDDYNGPRNVVDAYPVDENGVKTDEGSYIMLELEYGSAVASGHTGSYNYANYYTPLTLTYTVKWNSDTYKQHDVVSILCDEFILDRYTDESIEKNNFCDYAFFKPANTDKKRPLIIFFHGMGEGGAAKLNNKGVQMYAYPEANFASPEIQQIMGGGAYVLLPQSPEQWPTSGFTAESAYLDIVNSLIDNIIAENPDIDTDRIYVGGLSMGGYMASRVILNRPEKYAAAFLCSQAYAITEEDAEKLKDLPIWISCCESDGMCTMNPYTYASYVKLVEAGTKEAKCVVMEDNSNDPASRYRFYSSDSDNVDDFTMYYPVQENENKSKGQFVWDNVVYSGHNGGWVPVFDNGEYYEKEDGSKVTIMDWLACHTLNGIIDPNPTKAPEATPNVTTPTAAPTAAPTPIPAAANASVKVNTTKVVLFKKGLTKASVKASVTGSNEKVTWTSSDNSVAVVDSKGNITAKKAGTAVITAKAGNASSDVKVTVKNATFKIAKKSLTIKKGKTVKLKVTVSPKKSIKYKASSKAVKVNSKGLVKGVKKGSASIKVTYMGVSQTVSVKVK